MITGAVEGPVLESLAFLEGLALGASLIIAIGAQNAYVIRQGIKGEHVFAVAMVCALIDIVLISFPVNNSGIVDLCGIFAGLT